jgi:hypothetical protein
MRIVRRPIAANLRLIVDGAYGIFGRNVSGMAGNQSAEDLVMSRASARFTNLAPCFL